MERCSNVEWERIRSECLSVKFYMNPLLQCSITPSPHSYRKGGGISPSSPYPNLAQLGPFQIVIAKLTFKKIATVNLLLLIDRFALLTLYFAMILLLYFFIQGGSI